MDVDTAQPAVEAPLSTPPEVDPSTSLADHEAQFAPGAKRATPPPDAATEPSEPPTADVERDERGQFRKRAASQRATSEAVDEIAELTKRLRQAETDAGLTKPERKPGESDRAYSLRRQAEIVEALRDARKVPAKAQVPPPAALAPRQQPIAPPTAPKVTPVPFAEPAPNPEDFANADNPAEAYYRAIAAHEFRRQIHDAQQALNAQRATETQAEQQRQHAEQKAAHDARIQSFAAKTPDFWEKLESVEDIRITDLLAQTIFTDDKSAELMYYFASHPDQLAELSLITAPLEIDDQSVALLRRRLHAQAIDAPAKATLASPPVSAPVLVAPRPPTRVQTGPLKTGDEPPGDDDMSLSSHEKHFGPKRR